MGSNQQNNQESTSDQPTINQRSTTEEKYKKGRTNTCTSVDARRKVLFIENPPSEMTETDALFPLESSTSEQERWFEVWWSEYWLRKARKQALAAFKKHVRNEARFQTVMAATRAQRAEMLAREPRHRPYGATWLNAERWNDETHVPPQETAGGSTYTRWTPPEAVNG
jgi:hypothetical protein